jgi:hypothetical protein
MLAVGEMLEWFRDNDLKHLEDRPYQVAYDHCRKCWNCLKQLEEMEK